MVLELVVLNRCTAGPLQGGAFITSSEAWNGGLRDSRQHVMRLVHNIQLTLRAYNCRGATVLLRTESCSSAEGLR